MLYIGEYILISGLDYVKKGDGVVLAKYSPDGKDYVLKIMKKLAQNLNEKDIYETINANGCPFIIKYYGTFQTRGHLCFILEYVPGQTLDEYLKVAGKFTSIQAKFTTACILLALEFVHFKGVVHRDVSLDNVILASDGYLKLFDFGFSYLMKHSQSLDLSWKDMKALAFCLYSMLTGQICLTCEDLNFFSVDEIERNFLNNVLHLNSEIIEIKSLYHMIKDHHYFKDIRWDDLLNKRMIPPKFPKFRETRAESPKDIWEEVKNAEDIIIDSNQFNLIRREYCQKSD